MVNVFQRNPDIAATLWRFFLKEISSEDWCWCCASHTPATCYWMTYDLFKLSNYSSKIFIKWNQIEKKLINCRETYTYWSRSSANWRIDSPFARDGAQASAVGGFRIRSTSGSSHTHTHVRKASRKCSVLSVRLWASLSVTQGKLKCSFASEKQRFCCFYADSWR